MHPSTDRPAAVTLLDRIMLFCLERKVPVFLAVLLTVFLGVSAAPFDWELAWLPRNPIPVDAIPDIGENQQIVYTEWAGRSPQDVEDQVTYPLAASLLGVSGVKSVRSTSAFGFSSIYVIFKDDVDFYWSRSRILERLGSLPDNFLPKGVKPALGPDATGLGQVFWYTVEGVDEAGRPTGGWDPQELRTVQDWHVRYSLLAAEGVAEVASIGGFVREYQVDVDPALLRAYDVTLEDVAAAVRRSNLDVGARTLEINRVEYLVRGLGFVKSVEDLKAAVVATRNNTPIFLGSVATVALGPALRNGALDKNGSDAVGGVVVVRYGENPLAVIKNVKRKIAELSPGLPSKTLPDGTISRLRLVPFYDRTGLIQETLGTLNSALVDEVLVTVLTVLVMVAHAGSSLITSAVLPLAILLCFIAMKAFSIEANIIALSGIAIAIGTVVDMGIILTESVLRHIKDEPDGQDRLQTVFRAASEVGSAILASIATIVISFLPVFTLTGPEGRLFRPLAFTKTFTLAASAVLALMVIPAAAHLLFRKRRAPSRHSLLHEVPVYLGPLLGLFVNVTLGVAVTIAGLALMAARRLPERLRPLASRLANWGLVLVAFVLLARHWLPLGPQRGLVANLAFAGAVVGGWLLFFQLFQARYGAVLGWCLAHKRRFLAIPLAFVLFGGTVWLGFDSVFGWLPGLVLHSRPVAALAEQLPGLRREFMPPLDEGAFLFMPSTMPHASVAEAKDIVSRQDLAIRAIPEVSSVVGKLGRTESALDPAPISMIETVISYHGEFLAGPDGEPLRFRCAGDEVDLVRDRSGRPLPAADGAAYYARGRFLRDEAGALVPDAGGLPFRLWRPALDPAVNPGRTAWRGVTGPDDIWEQVAKAARLPGTTTAPKLHPISARLAMLQSGIRASVAVEVKGPTLQAVQTSSDAIERLLREVGAIEPSTVVADRIVAKPYLEIEVDRRAVAQYGFDLQGVQDVIESAIGGQAVTTTVEGRERYPVRVRYLRELRDDFESMERVLVSRADGLQVPLGQLARFRHTPGPMVIRAQDSFLVGYVLFDKKRGLTDVDAVREASAYLQEQVEAGELRLPPGVSYRFTGSYENHARSEKRLALILPLTLVLVFLVLYFQFGRLSTAALVFSGVAMAWAGGFLLIWLYGQPWFLDVSLFGVNLREVFQVRPINLSLAVWVGFLALFGIATNDGVVMATYLEDSFRTAHLGSIEAIRRATLEAGLKRVRPCLMTTATTILALVPVLTSRGRGADILIPMAVPSIGGMTLVVVTMLIVPVLYCALKEQELRRTSSSA